MQGQVQRLQARLVVGVLRPALGNRTSGPLDAPICKLFGVLDEVCVEGLHRLLRPAQGQMECIGEVEASFMPVDNLRDALPVAYGDIAQSAYAPQGGAYLTARKVEGGAQYPFGFEQDGVWDIDVFGGKERVAGLALYWVVAGQQPNQYVGINRYHATSHARPQPGRP